jgi:hypothetical protein
MYDVPEYCHPSKSDEYQILANTGRPILFTFTISVLETSL